MALILSDRLISEATEIFTLAEGTYFADAEVVVQPIGVSIHGSGLAFGDTQARAKCRSELIERWASFEWELAGRPPLPALGMVSGHLYADVRPWLPPADSRPDATGWCAGPKTQAAEVLTHGLLEVIERDTVTRLFDNGDPTVALEHVPVPARVKPLLRRQRARVSPFVATHHQLPATGVAIVSDARDRDAAIGTACRLDETAAVEGSILEGCMMLTTVRHQRRRRPPPASAGGVIWASEHGSELRQELARHAERTKAGSRTAGRMPLPVLVAEVFGNEPLAAKCPLDHSAISDVCAWRVIVPTARSPALVNRKPWPIG